MLNVTHSMPFPQAFLSPPLRRGVCLSFLHARDILGNSVHWQLALAWSEHTSTDRHILQISNKANMLILAWVRPNLSDYMTWLTRRKYLGKTHFMILIVIIGALKK